MSLEILYEDNHLICIDKPAGVLTQADRSGSLSLLESIKDHIKRRDNKPGNVFLGLVQRLDKPVSGVIVFAKTSKAASRLSEQIRKHQVFKFYLAVTEITAGGGIRLHEWRELHHYVYRKKAITLVSDVAEAGSQRAALRLRTLWAGNGCGLHLVQLLTGRKHQIRAQLSHLGLPICGDTKYGSGVSSGGPGIGLHSLCFGLVHPVRREELAIVAKPPTAILAQSDARIAATLPAILCQEMGWARCSLHP